MPSRIAAHAWVTRRVGEQPEPALRAQPGDRASANTLVAWKAPTRRRGAADSRSAAGRACGRDAGRAGDHVVPALQRSGERE